MFILGVGGSNGGISGVGGGSGGLNTVVMVSQTPFPTSIDRNIIYQGDSNKHKIIDKINESQTATYGFN